MKIHFAVGMVVLCLAACDSDTASNNEFEEPEEPGQSESAREGQRLCAGAGISSNSKFRVEQCVGAVELAGANASSPSFTLESGAVTITGSPTN